MKLYTVYFSPTGGTKKVLDELVKEWLINDGAPDESGKTSTELVEIDLSDRTRSGAFLSHATPGREDFCIIAVPSFGGRVPAAALERLTQLKAGHTPAVLVAAYGNRAYDDTLLELQEAAEHSGFCPVAAIAAVTEHSIMHQYGTGRPDAQDKAELRKFVRQIQELLRPAADCSSSAAVSAPAAAPTGNTKAFRSSRRLAKPVPAAAPAPKHVPWARFRTATLSKRTKTAASPVCAAFRSVR